MNLNRRLQALARQSCAAFVGTNGCRYAPNGQPRCVWFRDDPQARPFIEAGTMQCQYFEWYVLPANPALEARYWNREDNSTKCARCRQPFVKKSNRQKYCSSCRSEAERMARRRRDAEYRARKRRFSGKTEDAKA